MNFQSELFPLPLPAGFEYTRNFLEPEDAERLEATLLSSVPWAETEIVLFGKPVQVPRLTAWYGDADASYVYSGVRNLPLPWIGDLDRLRDLVSNEAGTRFNSVLLNRYRDGTDSVSWHRDDEPELGPTPTIASLSLGATRRFRLRNKQTRETHGLDLESGSLLLMDGESQRLWEHCVPKTRRQVGERINLTFRLIRAQQREVLR
jgi:alkylated DNA repair dioxygenase AlkB